MYASTSEISINDDIALFNEKYNNLEKRFPKEEFKSFEEFKK